jgi:prepilin-type N-terminal cleavage/methylation domain-containing protein
MKRSKGGFTLIEMMIVVVIIGILAALAIPKFMRAGAKSKQSEAKEVLKQIYTMQRAYFIENDSYCLNGVVADATNQNAFAILAIEIMPTARYSYTMAVIGQTQFTCTARANLDDDAAIDTWTIDNNGNLVNSIDDSQL